jgi:hypothetical protein
MAAVCPSFGAASMRSAAVGLQCRQAELLRVDSPVRPLRLAGFTRRTCMTVRSVGRATCIPQEKCMAEDAVPPGCLRHRLNAPLAPSSHTAAAALTGRQGGGALRQHSNSAVTREGPRALVKRNRCGRSPPRALPLRPTARPALSVCVQLGLQRVSGLGRPHQRRRELRPSLARDLCRRAHPLPTPFSPCLPHMIQQLLRRWQHRRASRPLRSLPAPTRLRSRRGRARWTLSASGWTRQPHFGPHAPRT